MVATEHHPYHLPPLFLPRVMSAPAPAAVNQIHRACYTCACVVDETVAATSIIKLECGHRVCNVCATAAQHFKCRACKPDAGFVGAPAAPTPSSAMKREFKHDVTVAMPGASQTACADCVGLGFAPSPVVSVCEGCNGADRALCEDHAYAHRKHARMKRRRLADTDAGLMTDAKCSVPLFCTAHVEARITRVCRSCKVFVCAECCLAPSEHPSHTHDV